MEKAKQSKHLIKEKNSNLKEIEDLRQKRETYEIHKMKVTFKINLVMTINLLLTQFLPEMRIGEMSSKLGEIGKSTGTQLTYPLLFFEPDPDRR